MEEKKVRSRTTQAQTGARQVRTRSLQQDRKVNRAPQKPASRRRVQSKRRRKRNLILKAMALILFVMIAIAGAFFWMRYSPSKEKADLAMDAASCIGCGACVAACKNGSAMLFVSAKVSQLALLPQGQVEAARRAKAMLAKMDELGFGNCTNTRACEAECPKCISISNIARLNREFISAKFKD